MKCYSCPISCGADRPEKAGACGVAGLTVAKYYLHPFEEPPISYQNGSGTVFFGGCSLKCVFCQNYELSRAQRGKEITPKELTGIFRALEEMGADNVNLVTPDHVSDLIAEALALYKPRIPVVYNSGGYCKTETLERIAPYIDVWLPDFKYSDEALGRKLSGRKNYPETALSAITKMRELSVDSYSDGVMRSGLIVRHLVLPGYIENSFGVLDAINSSIGNRTVVSIMSQFTPTAESSIKRRLKPIEYKAVVRHAEKCGFENAFIQDEASADSSYTPDFEV